MRSSPSTAAKSCRNRMCRQGGKYAVWVDLFHGDRKICCRQQRFRKKCTKIPGSLALPGIFSYTPGRSRTCDLQSRSLTLYPAELQAHPTNPRKIYEIFRRDSCNYFIIAYSLEKCKGLCYNYHRNSKKIFRGEKIQEDRFRMLSLRVGFVRFHMRFTNL